LKKVISPTRLHRKNFFFRLVLWIHRLFVPNSTPGQPAFIAYPGAELCSPSPVSSLASFPFLIERRELSAFGNGLVPTTELLSEELLSLPPGECPSLCTLFEFSNRNYIYFFMDPPPFSLPASLEPQSCFFHKFNYARSPPFRFRLFILFFSFGLAV